MAGVAVWFLTLTCSFYLGIADEARAQALKAISSRVNSSFRAPTLTDVLVGQMEAELVTAQAVRDHVVARLDADRSDPQQALSHAILCREVVIERAIAVVEKAVQLAGGAAFFRRSPLERLARDVRAGRFHPPAAPISFEMIGERVRTASQTAS